MLVEIAFQSTAIQPHCAHNTAIQKLPFEVKLSGSREQMLNIKMPLDLFTKLSNLGQIS